MEISEISFLDIEENNGYVNIINKVIEKCYEKENLANKKLYVNVVLTNSDNIRNVNKEYRDIDRETDVLSFPMFEKEEIKNIIENNKQEEQINFDILGDIVISIEQIEKQAKEYEHSFERELSYMIVHSFYHLLGYDHMKEKDKVQMRKKEKSILQELNIIEGGN